MNIILFLLFLCKIADIFFAQEVYNTRNLFSRIYILKTERKF